MFWTKVTCKYRLKLFDKLPYIGDLPSHVTVCVCLFMRQFESIRLTHWLDPLSQCVCDGTSLVCHLLLFVIFSQYFFSSHILTLLDTSGDGIGATYGTSLRLERVSNTFLIYKICTLATPLTLAFLIVCHLVPQEEVFWIQCHSVPQGKE